jgi:hypothetical protein
LDTAICNKENVGGDYPAIDEGNIVKKSSLRSSNGRQTTGKKVQIVEPGLKGRSSKLKKRKVSPASSVFSDAGSSFTPPSPSPSSPVSSSPKRSWFGNVFSFKPVTYTLFSKHDVRTTRNECRRLLMGMEVHVVLEDSEGLGVLKCYLDEARDPNRLMAAMKAVRFRVEVQRFIDGEIFMLLVHEKGALDSFKEVHKRLRRDWDMEDSEAQLLYGST